MENRGEIILYQPDEAVRLEVRLEDEDVIISVGYRVKSIRGTQFRQWANKVLKEYLLQGRKNMSLETICKIENALGIV